jgi:hypothetical protein
VSKEDHTVLAFVPHFRPGDLQFATDAYAIELAHGRTQNVALNYAAAVYVQRHPLIKARDARAMIRAAISIDF